MDLSPSGPPPNPNRRGSASSLSEPLPNGPPNPSFGRDRRSLAQNERRVSAQSLKVPSRTNSVSPDDGYNYGDVGPSPEGAATTERDNANIQADVPEMRLDGRPTKFGPSELEKVIEDLKPSIFERQAGRRRAKLPDEENPRPKSSEPVTPDSNKQSPAAPQLKSRRPPWLWWQHRNDSRAPKVDEKSKLRHVMLHWGKGKEDIKGTQKLIVNATLPSVTDQRSDSQNHVVWQHSELQELSFDKLEDLVNKSRPQGLQESEIGLTRRLLRRVRKKAERDFVGGSFLTPLALRYDILDDSIYSVDKCCIFLSFPYFDVHQPLQKRKFKKGHVEHPTRTLLQSRYRLNETTERDKSQCVRMLKGEALKACVDALNPICDRPMPKVTEELIHVPQLWALIMGVDRMITVGPISELALQGSSIKINDNPAAENVKKCSLVRILFSNRGKHEYLTYPIEQCACWFGLLNKHQQIRSILKKGVKKNSKAEVKQYDPHEYKLEIGGHIIDNRTWPAVQQSADGEVLEIWMRTPKRRVLKVSVKMDGESDSPGVEPTDDERLPEDVDPPDLVPVNDYKTLPSVPIVSAFLEWKILDEFGEPDNCPITEKLNRFLNAIYRSLLAVCVSNTSKSSKLSTASPKLREGPRVGARAKIMVDGKFSGDVDNLVYRLMSSCNADDTTVEQRLSWEYKKLFKMFIPGAHDRKSLPIRTFWGAVYEIMRHRSYLESFLEKLQEIAVRAEQIHLGVYHQICKGDEEPQGAVSDSAVLLSSMVDALGAVFNMLIEAVREVQSEDRPVGGQRSTCGKKVVSNCEEACRLLDQAKDELINEATGAAAGENIGPVLTPEAILIVIVERLGGGVFGQGSVDVINIYEECLEHLALKVKDRASRRLLQMVNAFEEEISIVNDVLLQQQRVLLELGKYLNPTTFKNPSIARKMRFEFEKKGIEEILALLQEQLHGCNELKERARVLAKQNVQLVETLQDDNGRAIFIFTFITVLFLPLSFVAGFFGMNLSGISGTTQTTSHFWYIALPVTAAIMILCALVIFEGEDLWFALKFMPRNLMALSRTKKGDESG